MPKESMQTLLRRAKEIATISGELRERIGGRDTGYEGDFEVYCKQGGAYLYIAGVFLHSAADDFGAVFLLLEKKLSNGAFLSLRRLVELDIDLRFIGNRHVERAKEFLYFGPIQQEKYIQALENEQWAQTLGIDEDRRNSIRASYKMAMKAMGCKKAPLQWSGKNWRDKCREIDRKLREMKPAFEGMTFERTYDIIYKRCCSYTHPSALGLESFIKDVPSMGPVYMQPVGEAPLIAALAIRGFLDIILNVNRIFKAGLDGEITRVYQGMRGWVRV